MDAEWREVGENANGEGCVYLQRYKSDDQIEYEKNVAEKKSWWEKTWDTITEWTKKFIDPIVESVADFFERNCAPIKIITSACGFIGGIIWGVFGLK